MGKSFACGDGEDVWHGAGVPPYSGQKLDGCLRLFGDLVSVDGAILFGCGDSFADAYITRVLAAEIMFDVVGGVSLVRLAGGNAHGRGDAYQDGLRDGIRLECGEHRAGFMPTCMKRRA